MSIADKLVDINNIKLDIKDAIEAKGVSMTGATFSDYPDKIALIPTGSTGGTTCTDSYIVSGFTGGTYVCVKQYLNFDNTTGFDSTVYALVIDNNNKLYVGGYFITYKGVAANRIIRLNTDGSIDTGFTYGTGFNSTVYALVIDSDGKIYVGGDFTSYKGVAANYVIRLNTDGSIDTGFTYGTGFNSTVRTFAIDNNNKLYVGGNFTSYKGVAANRIIRLNTDGSIDTGFTYGTGFNSTVYALVIDSNNKLYVGGNFITYKGVAANRIIRLNTDGSKDTDFDNTTGFNNIVYALAIDSDNKLYVGGSFTSYKGVTANRIIRLNTDGSIDTGFTYGTGFNSTVNIFAIDSNGKIYVGGGFTSYKGVTASRIIRLNTDGSIDTGFTYGTGFNNYVNTLTIDSNNKLYVGGNFITYKANTYKNVYVGVAANYVIRLKTDGNAD